MHVLACQQAQCLPVLWFSSNHTQCIAAIAVPQSLFCPLSLTCAACASTLQAVQVNYTTSVAYRGMEQAWYNPSPQGHRHTMLTHHAHQ